MVGWLVALLAALVVRKALGRTTVDNKIARWMSGPDAKAAVPIEQWASKAVFYLIMLIVLVGVLLHDQAHDGDRAAERAAGAVPGLPAPPDWRGGPDVRGLGGGDGV